MKKKTKKKINVESVFWIIASILEWMSIVLYIAAIGYDINIDIYNKLKDWQYEVTLFYIVSGIDATIFALLVLKNRKYYNPKNLLLAVFCSLLQIILIILKVKY